MNKIKRQKSEYQHIEILPTRWSDNDMYGHVNNVVYYAYFDTVVNRLLISHGWLAPTHDSIIAVVAETQCQFFSSVAYPQILEIGLAIERIGSRSVTYNLGVFIKGEENAAAQGRFVHVYVDHASRLPVAIPDTIRQGLLRYCW